MANRFRDAMRLMRKHDPQLREDGFHRLRPHAAEHVEELMTEYLAEQDDHGLRCWLVELIGEARSETARPLLTELLDDESESIRDQARRGLELLGAKK
jgi:HEAT repeat protein